MSIYDEEYDWERSQESLEKYLENSRIEAVNKKAYNNKAYRDNLQEYNLIMAKIFEMDKRAGELLMRMDFLNGQLLSFNDESAYQRGLTDAVVMLRRLGLLDRDKI